MMIISGNIGHLKLDNLSQTLEEDKTKVDLCMLSCINIKVKMNVFSMYIFKIK